MSLNVTIGATLTGGTSTALTPAGLYAGGKASFTTPTHTRLEPQIVDFLVTAPTPKGSDPGVARSGVKIAFANRVEAEGCCTIVPGTIIADIGVRWPLAQPEAVVDEVIAWIRGVVYTTAFADAIKKGVLPTG